MSPSVSTTSHDSVPSSRKRKHESSLPVEDAQDAKSLKHNKACLNCRKQKMKCEMDSGPPCRRCTNTNVSCLFKVRANGLEAGDWHIGDAPSGSNPSFEAFKASVLARLHTIESRLGIAADSQPPRTSYNASRESSAPVDDVGGVEHDRTNGLPDLAIPLFKLSTYLPFEQGEGLLPAVVEALWLAFAEHMPALHFATQRLFVDIPTPLLLAAILYAASMQHTLAEYARLSPFYRRLAARAIGDLAIPQEGSSVENTEDEDLHDTLGIIIMGLMCEAWVNTTGVWISMAYQRILARAPNSRGTRPVEWKSLYEGLRVIDIEHASLRMACPLLSLTVPIANLQSATSASTSSRARLAEQAYAQLTTIMHVGISHFSGRNLPSLVKTVLGYPTTPVSAVPLSAEDRRMIKGWAAQLDAWLSRYHRPPKQEQRGPSDANVILLQYQLHKLFVFSIYYSARGVDLRAGGSLEVEELLSTARGALQLQRKGLGVWSNWDLVLITHAALILLDSVHTGEIERNDRLLVQGHINALRTTHQPAPNLRLSLADRLDARLANVSVSQVLWNPETTVQQLDPFNADPMPLSQLAQPLEALPMQEVWSAEQNSRMFEDLFGDMFQTTTEPSAPEQDLSFWLNPEEGNNEPTIGAPWPRAFTRIMGGLDLRNDA